MRAPDLELVAFHEAGHAVAGIRLGVEVRYVALRGYLDTGDARSVDGAVGYEGVFLPAPQLQVRHALFHLAGPEAERRYLTSGRPWAPEADTGFWWGKAMAAVWAESDVAGALDVVGRPTLRDGEWWDTFPPAAVNLGGLWWPQVEAVAKALRQRGRLSVAEVEELADVPGWGRAQRVVDMIVRSTAAAWPGVNPSHRDIPDADGRA